MQSSVIIELRGVYFLADHLTSIARELRICRVCLNIQAPMCRSLKPDRKTYSPSLVSAGVGGWRARPDFHSISDWPSSALSSLSSWSFLTMGQVERGVLLCLLAFAAIPLFAAARR